MLLTMSWKRKCGLKWYWPICVSYKHRGSRQKFTFSKYPIPEIPDDSEKKIGYGSGTAKNYRVGSGIGYPSVTGWGLRLGGSENDNNMMGFVVIKLMWREWKLWWDDENYYDENMTMRKMMVVRGCSYGAGSMITIWWGLRKVNMVRMETMMR